MINFASNMPAAYHLCTNLNMNVIIMSWVVLVPTHRTKYFSFFFFEMIKDYFQKINEIF